MKPIQIVSLLVFFGALHLTFAILVMYNLFVFYKYGVDATISRSMLALSNLSGMFPFIVGLWMGGLTIGLAAHFWWHNQ